MRRRCVFLGGSTAGGVGVVLASVTMSAGQARANDGEHAVVPYTCAFDRGRIVLTPAPDRQYRVVGPRTSHAFTACAPTNPNTCRTWQIHKFDLACGGQRVPWLAFAGAIIERTPQRGQLDNGRLSLRLGPAWQRRDAQPLPIGFKRPFDRPDQLLAFPAGFAPALGTGLRFVGVAVPPPTVVDARGEAKVTKPESRSVVSGRPAAPNEAGDATFGLSASVTEAWITTVVPASVVAVTVAELNPVRAAIGLMAVAVLWGGLVFARRRTAKPASLEDNATAAPNWTDDDAALCSEMIARSVNLHRAARDAVGAVPSENLRDILTADLAKVQRHLLSAELTNDVAEERWHAVKPRVTIALADLERIARIIAGVLSSQPTPDLVNLASVVPESAEQAFEVLGINPNASRTVVKKIVDGLRQSWHPDHASDEADRGRREDRMKQINAAWDLIRARYGVIEDSRRLETERAA